VAGPDLDNPAATMFSLVMLVWTRAGKAHSLRDYSTWMREAGLAEPRVHPSAGMPSSWLVAGRA
jgi:hypothetical protein